RRRTAPAERRTAGVAGYAATPARRSFPSQTRPPAPRRVSSMQQTRQEHPMYARSTPVPLAVVAAFVLAGCGGGAGSQAGHEPVPVRSTDVVTQEELGRVATASTLYEALHALRPGWFRRNPTTLRPQTEGDVVVYVDQSRLGGPEALRTLQVNAAVAIRHYSASEAEARFGPGELHGPRQPLDTATHYLILPDNIGHGASSKPSDGLKARFPHYTYADMVAAQYRLVTEGLHVDRLLLVMGTSMGCMHAWLWAERHPDFMDGVVPLACAPTQIAGRNRMMRGMII